MCVCVCVQVRVCRHKLVTLSVIPQELSTLGLIHCPRAHWFGKAAWLASTFPSELGGSSCPCDSVAGTTNTCHSVRHFCIFLEVDFGPYNVQASILLIELSPQIVLINVLFVGTFSIRKCYRSGGFVPFNSDWILGAGIYSPVTDSHHGCINSPFLCITLLAFTKVIGTREHTKDTVIRTLK